MKKTRWPRATWMGIAVFAGAAALPAEDWPQFRGPTGDGLAAATHLPLTWSPTQNMTWKAPVPGRGRSSPVLLAEGRLYCFSREGKTVVLQANKDLTLLAENQLEGPVFASPALVGSAIYLRTDSHLYCLQRLIK